MATNEPNKFVPEDQQAAATENKPKKLHKMFKESLIAFKKDTGMDLEKIIEEEVSQQVLQEELRAMETFDAKITGLKINVAAENKGNDDSSCKYNCSCDKYQENYRRVMELVSTEEFSTRDYSSCWELLALAKEFNLPEPKLNEIRSHLFYHVWFNYNYWVAYQEGLKLKEETLVEVALMAIYSAGFSSLIDHCESYEFLYLEPEYLLPLLQVDCFRFEEDRLFNACIAWARNRASRTIPGTDTVEPIRSPTTHRLRLQWGVITKPDYPMDHKLVRKYMDPLLPHFRFFSLPRAELKKLLQKSKIFSPIAIEMLCNPKSKLPNTKTFRSKFCQLTTPRNKRPVRNDLYIHGLDEKFTVDADSLIHLSPFSRLSCYFPLFQARTKNLSQIVVHFCTMLKTEELQGDSYQERCKVLMHTLDEDSCKVLYVSDTYEIEAQFNSTAEVQFKLPPTISELEVKLMVVHHSTGLYPNKKPWLAMIDNSS